MKIFLLATAVAVVGSCLSSVTALAAGSIVGTWKVSNTTIVVGENLRLQHLPMTWAYKPPCPQPQNGWTWCPTLRASYSFQQRFRLKTGTADVWYSDGLMHIGTCSLPVTLELSPDPDSMMMDMTLHQPTGIQVDPDLNRCNRFDRSRTQFYWTLSKE